MTSRVRKTNSSYSIKLLVPEQFSYIFEHKPVLWCESETIYSQLLADLLAELAPVTVLEYHWVKNIADIQWEIMRHQRLKSAALVAEMPEATREYLGFEFNRQAELLGLKGGGDTLMRVIRLAGKGNSDSQDKVDRMVEAAGISHDEMLYKSYAAAGSAMGEIASRLLKLEQRRDDLIRRFQERRRSLAAHEKALLGDDRDIDTIDLDRWIEDGKRK